jgi:glycosyltransferase involved in cell wall biosynthesis
MRVAFPLIGGREWTGGYNYLLNLLRVLHHQPGHGIEPLLFVGEQVPDEHLAPFLPLLAGPPVRGAAFERRSSGLHLSQALALGTVPAIARAFERERIDVAFEAAQFYGWRFPVATLAWTPDFQHRHLPHMFSRRAWWRRELGHQAQIRAGRTLMLSSEDARRDAERFYPASRGRTVVVRFAVLPPEVDPREPGRVLGTYGLPERFLYLPNQFWKHKNHAVIVEALALLKARGINVVVAASGNPNDTRHQDHYWRLVERVQALGLENEFRLLGMIPYEDVIRLTSLSLGVVNPSFFEGWSTTVEEAKALGAPLVLSDLGVHREQAGGAALYFEPRSPSSAAEALERAWYRDDLQPAEVRRAAAAEASRQRVSEFARTFALAVESARARARNVAAPVAVPVVPPPARRSAAADAGIRKVLLIHNFYRSAAVGGEDNVFRQERELLERAGVEVIVYTRSNDDVDENDQYEVLRTAASMSWSRRSYQDVSALIRREQPQLAHFHNTFPLVTPSAYAACRDQGVPVVQTLHNYRLVCSAATFFRDGHICETCTPGRPWAGVQHRCYRHTTAGSAAVAWMLWSNWRRGTFTQLVDLYVTLTQFAADKFVSLGLPAERIRVKPNFVADSGGVGPGRGGYAVFAGRLSDEKGIDVMLDGWKQLRDVPLIVVGDGPLRAAAEARVRELSLPVRFLGVRPRLEVLDIIGRADVQVVPSECYEGFPLVIVEALARGTPLAVSRLGGLIEIVHPEVTGLHFEPSDPLSLAQAVRRLWSDAELRARIRLAGRQEYEERYTPARNLEQMLEIYGHVVRRDERASPLARTA